MRKLNINNPKWVRDLIHTSVKTSCEPSVVLRLCCMLLIARGRSCYEIARWFGENPRTIERWVHALNLHGIDGLREHHAGGRPTKLVGGQEKQLALDLQKSPCFFGYTEHAWSGKRLAQHLESCYAVSLSPRQCQRLLRRLAQPAAAQSRLGSVKD